jgi:GNAT superfamily N-acetyltransferase
MLMVMVYRAMRSCELYKERRRHAPEYKGDAHLPAFSWSPSGPCIARIMGILVRREHRGKGVATKLYFRLFETLAEKNCLVVEEYLGPDYYQFVGKYHDCGWQLQQLRGDGYKMTKHLKEPNGCARIS